LQPERQRVNSRFSVTFPSPSQIACNSSGDINIKACAAGYANTLKNLQFWFNYTDPATPAAGSPVMQLSRDLFATSVNLGTVAPSSVVTPTPVSVNFDSTATAKVRVRYDDVGRLTLQLRDSAATSVTGSGSVIVRPATFAVTSVTDQAGTLNNPGASDATGARFIAAGRSFRVTAAARNNCSTPAAVRNFGRESSSEGIRFDATLAPGLGLTNNPALVTVTDFSFTNGSGTATLQWPEAGILRLTPRLKSGNYLGGSVDVIGTSTGNVGRFFADRLDTVVNTQGCSLGGFTYDRQPLPRVTLTAKAATGETLRNYVGSSTPTFNFAKTVSLTDNTGNGTLAPSIPSQAFAAGVGVLDGVDANHPRATFSFNTSPSAPAAIGIVATDSDAGPGTAVAGSANVRSGRLRMPNAYGSDRLALPILIEAQFWTGTAWATNTLDSCTTLPLSAMVMGPYVAPLAACTTWLTPSSVTLNAGRPLTDVQLTRPDVNGSVTLTLNTSATASGNTCLSSAASSATAANLTWFGQPTARATFGIYRSPLIYRRENY
jgi:MSHA biogenesis protein MshQ